MAGLLKSLWCFSGNKAESQPSSSSAGQRAGSGQAKQVNGDIPNTTVATRTRRLSSTSQSSEESTHAGKKLLQELRALNLRNIRTLKDVALSGIKGEPMDDQTYLMERIIQLATDLPYQSVESETLTKLFLTQLWDDLQHPPQTSLGSKFVFRQADGSNNSVLFPNIGAAGQAYARTVRPKVEQPVARPDPGQIFDSVLARNTFTPHPNSISSVLFYIASIIIHDIFHTSHRDFEISETSSYLDLAPLYGSNGEEQMLVRSGKDGKLKADCFADKRILGFPPGVGVLLIFFNRFHNSAVETLAKIDENARFSSILRPRGGAGGANAEQEYDEALFQTGRLVTTGLYINMILKDYVRTILNLNSVNSKWSLDPRSEEGKALVKNKIAEGQGNQVSAEFNLIYRWHSTISQRDEAWTEAAFKQLVGDKDPAGLSMAEVLQALQAWVEALPADPQQRPFHTVERQADGRLADDQLAAIWIDSVNDVAGAFQTRHVPRVMRSIEMLGIIQARSWNLASLNEFREYFNLTAHKTFEDINPDPYIQQQLRNLYGHPDNVELYPGVIVEAAKKSMSPGSGLCTNFTISRAILSDAVSLVRSDRFYTIDYTPQNLTNWGFKVVEYDTSIDYGCVLNKVVLTALPNHFATNSIYAHYPLVTPTKNQALLKRLGQAQYYDFEAPKGGRQVRTVRAQGEIGITTGLWSRRLIGLGGPRPASSQPLSAVFFGTLAKGGQWKPALHAFFLSKIQHTWQQGQYSVGDFEQIDIVRDVVNEAYVRFLMEAGGFSDGDVSKLGESFDSLDLQKLLSVLFDFGFTAAPGTTLNGARRKQVRKLAELIAAKVAHGKARAGDDKAEVVAVEKYVSAAGKHAWSAVAQSGDDATHLAWTQVLAEFALTIVSASRLSAQLIDKVLSGGPAGIAAAQSAGVQATQGQSTGLADLITQATAESAQVTIASDAAAAEAQGQTVVYNVTGLQLSANASVKIAADLHEACAGALLQVVGPLASFGRVPGPLGQLKQVRGEGDGMLYLDERQNRLSNGPTMLKYPYDNGLADTGMGANWARTTGWAGRATGYARRATGGAFDGPGAAKRQAPSEGMVRSQQVSDAASAAAAASPAVAAFVDKLLDAPLAELPQLFASWGQRWSYPRGDLMHWVGPLDRFDAVLEAAIAAYGLDGGPQTRPFGCRVLLDGSPGYDDEAALAALGFGADGDRQLVEAILDFSRLLMEKCANRPVYNSTDRLNALLNTTSLSLLHQTLRLTIFLAQRYADRVLPTSVPAKFYEYDHQRLRLLASPMATAGAKPAAASDRDWAAGAVVARVVWFGRATSAATDHEAAGASDAKPARVIEYTAAELGSTTIEKVLEAMPADVPAEQQYELLHKLRIAYGLMSSSPNSRQDLLAIRILAINTLANVFSNGDMYRELLTHDSGALKPQELVKQLVSLIQEPKRAEQPVRRYMQTLSMETLGGDDWREAVFSMPRVVLEAAGHHGRSGENVMAADFISAYASGFTVTTAKAMRIHLRMLDFVKTYFHHFKDGLHMLLAAGAFDHTNSLLRTLVDDAWRLFEAGRGIAPCYRTRLTDYQIPHLHQQIIRSIIDMVNDISRHQGPNADRVLRSLVDAQALPAAFKRIIANLAAFGAQTWSETVKAICAFLNNDPPSYNVFAEAAIIDSFLATITNSQHASISNSQHLSPAAAPASIADSQHLSTAAAQRHISSVSRQQGPGIPASIDAILNVAAAFEAICLTTPGFEAFKASGALEKFFQIFESAAHVKAMSETKSLRELGQTFDELVRHHPNLRSAVTSAIIVMLARVRHIGRAMAFDLGAGPKLWRLDGPENSVSGGRDALHTEIVPPPRADTDLLTLRAIKLPSGDHQDQDINRDDQDGAGLTISDYLRPAVGFLSAFLSKPSTCATLLDCGAQDIILDLVTLPSIPASSYPFGLHGFLDELSGVIHMLAEIKPHLILPLLTERAQYACDQLTRFCREQPRDATLYFAPFIFAHSASPASPASPASASAVVHAGTRVVRSLTAVYCLATVLAEVFNAPVYGARTAQTYLFGQVNRAIKPLWATATAPDHFTTGDDQINKLLGVWDTARADNALIPVSSTPAQQEAAASLDKDRQSAAFKNVKTIRYLVLDTPTAINDLLTNLGHAIVGKRRPEHFPRQKIALVANALAKTYIDQLQPSFLRHGHSLLDRDARFAYLVVSLSYVRNCFYDVNPAGTATVCQSYIIQAFKDQGGLGLLTHIVDSHQASVLKSADPSKPFYFVPQQLLLDLRIEGLPLARAIWDSDYADQAPPDLVQKVISILKNVLTGDKESDAARSQAGHPPPATHTPRKFTIDGQKLRALQDKGYAEDLAREALYRTNSTAQYTHRAAEEYCEAMVANPRRQRLHAPAADTDLIDLGATTPPPLGAESNAAGAGAAAATRAARPAQPSPSSAMHLSHILNESEPSQLPTPTLEPAAEAAQQSSNKHSVEAIEAKRAELRANLVDRCNNLLAGHQTLAFELRALISSATKNLSPESAKVDFWDATARLLTTSLISTQGEEDVMMAMMTDELGKRVAAAAHLIGLINDDDQVFRHTWHIYRDNFDGFLAFLDLPQSMAASQAPDHVADHVYPWVAPILLIIEPLLAKDCEPDDVRFDPPRDLDSFTPAHFSTTTVWDMDQKTRLFNTLVNLLPRVAKDRDMALAIARVLVILTRRRELAARLAQRENLHKLFFMIKDLPGGLGQTKLLSPFMIILRHMLEDEDTLKQIMRSEIKAAFSARNSGGRTLDLQTYTRELYYVALRDPKAFVDVTQEMLKFAQWSNHAANGIVAASDRINAVSRQLSGRNQRQDDEPFSEPDNDIRPTTRPDSAKFKPDEHPIFLYTCFLLSCLPRSAILNYLLTGLVCSGYVDKDNKSLHCRKKIVISDWACKVIVALCAKTGEKSTAGPPARYSSSPVIEDNDDEPDLTAVRRFVLGHAIRAFKDATASTEPLQIKYSKLLCLSDMFNRLLSKPVPTEGSAGAHSTSYKVIGRMMFDKDLVSVLTSSLAEIDLSHPSSRRVIKFILKPLQELTATATQLSLTSPGLISSVLGNSSSDDNISYASSVSDVQEDREETPDLYRNSALGMLDPNRSDLNNLLRVLGGRDEDLDIEWGFEEPTPRPPRIFSRRHGAPRVMRGLPPGFLTRGIAGPDGVIAPTLGGLARMPARRGGRPDVDDGSNPLLHRSSSSSNHPMRPPMPPADAITITRELGAGLPPELAGFMPTAVANGGGVSTVIHTHASGNQHGAILDAIMGAIARGEPLFIHGGRSVNLSFNGPGITELRDALQTPCRLIFGSSHVDKVARITKDIQSRLYPDLQRDEKERRRRQGEEEDRLRLEKEAEQAKAEEEARERKRQEEARIEQEEPEAEAEARTAHASAALASAGHRVGAAEPMEGVQPTTASEEAAAADTAADANQAGPSSSAGAQADQPRVFTTIRGRQLDITGLDIDHDYLEALPEELREEVIMHQYASRREEAQQQTGNADASGIDPDFLNALPEDIREEIRQQEAHAQRRREREEARRQQAQTAGQGQAGEMDNDDFFATLDPVLRRAILAEQPAEILDQLAPRHAQEGREHARRIFHPFAGLPIHPNDGPGRDGRASRRDPKRQVVQLIDKAGVATLLRLMFLPQQGSLKANLWHILRNVCGNRQTRFEVINILLVILKEGSTDVTAVERSLASLSLRAKASSAQKTPQPLKRTLSMPPSSGLADEVTPLVVVQQCLAALRHLSQHGFSIRTIFLREVDISANPKLKKGKGKDAKTTKYPVNDLISLLDRKLIMDSSPCLQSLAELLAAVTAPLNDDGPKAEDDESAPTEAATTTSAQPSAQADTVMTDRQQDTTTSSAQSSAQADAVMTDDASAPPHDTADQARQQQQQPADEAPTSDEQKEGGNEEEEQPKKKFEPPHIPESNLELVVRIFVAQECTGETFHAALETMSSISTIPATSPVFSRELIGHVRRLSESIRNDIEEFLPVLREAQSSTDLSGPIASKFSQPGSDQIKLLQVLKALDFLAAPKKDDNSDESTAKSILTASYEGLSLGPLWTKVSECLAIMSEKDNVIAFATILLPLIESLMVVCKHTSLKDTAPLARQTAQSHIPTSPGPVEDTDSVESLFFNFTTEHRKILNDIIRQSPKLMQGAGSFSLLVKNPKVLDFDNKRAYFTKQIHSRLHQQRHVQTPLQLNVRRDQVFQDSYKALYYKSADEMKYGKLNIRFNGEEGVDAGGVTREWFQVLARGIFNPNWALWEPVAADKTTFHPSKLSWVNNEHLYYFKFVGRIIGKALHEGRVLDCHFSRAVYKRMLGKQPSLKDLESMDLDYLKSLQWILENDITDSIMEDFSVTEEQFGESKIIDLIPNGRNVGVTEENKHDYVQKIVQYRLFDSVKEQMDEFVKGFHDIIPADLIAIFDEQELELLISGLPEIDVDDWKANTEYHNYNANSPQVTWFWRIVRAMSNEERAKLLQFITGTSKVPLNGFKDLEGMQGTTKFSIHRDPSQNRLPTSHTCFNQLDLPAYDNQETLKTNLMTAINLGADYFGFA
ncbi:hypothetical protein DV737_g2008, partial [Chaetothyriales sp. CBS 132003]